jgi:hypothetical protein
MLYEVAYYSDFIYINVYSSYVYPPRLQVCYGKQKSACCF